MLWIKAVIAALIVSAGVIPVQAQKAEREIRVATPFQKATRTYERGEYARARLHSLEACRHGDAKGCALLADLNRRGLGGPQDIGTAIGYYEQSCNGGQASSCATLAWLYHRGTGVDQDYTQARALYDKSCKDGEISACAAYGNMVYAGLGGPKDTDAGKILLRQACRNEYEWACERLWQYGLNR